MSDQNLTLGAIGLALDMAQRRAEVASHNVAYANMPGGRVQRADFGDALALLQRVANGDTLDISALSSVRMGITTQQPNAADGAPSLDHEVTELALANAHYQALSEAATRPFALMSLALSGDQS
jgi:flagellar basal body rod protein FlgB